MAIAPTEFTAEVAPLRNAIVPDRSRSFAARLFRHPLGIIGAVIILLLVSVALYTFLIAQIDPAYHSHISPYKSLPHGVNDLGEPHAPGGGFLAGADTLGRDVWTRTLYGTQISLLVAVCAMVTAVIFGTTIGLLGGYFGGWIDIVLTRITETVLSLPTILLAIAFSMVIPGDTTAEKLFKLLLAISVVTWTGIARAVRGQTLALKEREFVEAARAVGCSHGRILFVHLLPNVMPVVIVLATLATAQNILLEAGLSYLGLGMDPSVPSWGNTIRDGQAYIIAAPWIILAPGVAIVIAVAGFNLLGRALEEIMEPRR
jgi:ABC-type dipeptide/oligopeptide/nickel transport system permease subunit